MYIYLDLFKAETDSEEKESLAKQAYKMALNAWKYSPNNEQTKRQVAITADKWATFLSNKKIMQQPKQSF
ncbi:MAG: hypothetical protein HWD59_09675 [Coxiellaceae bacterium]|nr:MAG: hypothetical protein HWD59_09675 [Coxiellaceae bacterium]